MRLRLYALALFELLNRLACSPSHSAAAAAAAAAAAVAVVGLRYWLVVLTSTVGAGRLRAGVGDARAA